jgi:predicted extracellular nuclease
MKTFARRLALVMLLSCGAAGAAHAQVVISQVYGGGGNSGATYKSDFIELRNNSAAAVTLDGWSVQYASSTGTSWQRTNLAGSIAPGGYFLVKEADGAGGTITVTADINGTIAMSATAGKVALVRNTTTLSGACPLGTTVADFIGFSSGANCFEGTGPTSAPSNTSAVLRKGDGSIDTDNNSGDFATGAPNPRNSGSTPPPPPPPPTAVGIGQLQGSGLRSPYVGQNIVTEGIITARKYNNGFFLQGVSDDGDPATSEAVFVYTGSAPPASAAIGNRVRVTGKVDEFTPSTNPNQLSITEVINPTVELLSTGGALPAAIELGADVLSPDAMPATLERYEGMRVSVAQAVVVGASDGNIDEVNETSSSDGVFYVTLRGVPTPFREPGIGALDVIPIPAGKNPPRFDTNPERLMVRSFAQVGASPLSVDDGAQVSGLLGVLDYFDGTWALLPDASTPPGVSGGMPPRPVGDAGYADVTIGGFNLERFFDDIDDNDSAPTLTAAALDKRLGKTSAAICDYLKAPDILGVVEVENLHVLGLLADRINSSCARAPGYVPYLVEGNDIGGIDVGLLVSARDNGAGVARVEVREVTQYGKDATLANPDGSTSLLNDRPPLLLRATVHQANGASYPVTMIVNHLRSLNDAASTATGSNGWATAGDRVRGKRAAQAAYLAGIVQQLQQANPDEKIVLLGDFNAFEFNDGYVDVLGIIRGNEVAEDQVLTWVPSPVTTPLVDGSQLVTDPAQRYSYVFQGNAQSLDHALVNQALLGSALGVDVDHARINSDFGVDNFGDAGVPVRVSDHDPVRIAITVPAFRSADLSATASARSATTHVGDSAQFDVTVANAGPGAADYASVAFAFDALLSPAVTAPDGWSCTTPVQDAVNTTVTCTTPSLAAGADAQFTVAAIAPDARAGGTLHLAVATASGITDPANGNNDAAAGIGIVGNDNLAVVMSGPAKKLHYADVVAFPVTLRNAGPDASWQPVLALHGDAPAANVAIAAPAGWQCAVATAGEGFDARCSHAAAFSAGASQRFDFAVTIPARPNSTQSLTLRAEAASTTPETDPADNTATYSNRIVGVP